MKKVNLAFVISSLNPGGAERVLSILANELIEDYNITIITLYKSEPFYKLNNNILVEYCQQLYIDNPTKWQSLTNHIKLFYKLFKIIRKHKIEICIGFMTTSNIYVTLASKLKRMPCIISERIHPEHYDIGKFWNFVRKKTYPLATKLVVQTQSIKSYFEAYMKRDQLVIIKNPLAPELTAKRNLKITKNQIILNIGRLDYQKNQDLLIKAFANIKNDDWRLHIIGEGVNRKVYEDLIKSLNIENKVNLLGNKTDVDTYYNESSIFVFSSRFEGFPNALTEAMYFGLPCISTDCPSGPSELIKDGINGFLTPVENQQALEKKLQNLMDDASLREMLSKNAIKSTEEFQSEIIANQWKSIINKLLN
uniref:glycosyltransferase family 4 protein n=1 Tax=Gelidibacter sp. TaxID=2018083 RepID=UPI00404AF2C4